MAAFAKAEWQRLDFWAIVGSSGLAVIDTTQRIPCQEWLRCNDYSIQNLDLSGEAIPIISELDRLFDWEKQFGYKLGPSLPSLNALNDGFNFNALATKRCVLEVIGADLIWQENPEWLLGLLSIAQEHCREHLALGHRFFTLLILPEHSPLIGAPIEHTRVPGMFWTPYKDRHEFRD